MVRGFGVHGGLHVEQGRGRFQAGGFKVTWACAAKPIDTAAANKRLDFIA